MYIPDINECKDKLLCGNGGTCVTRRPGSYDCNCNKGFRHDGKQCIGKGSKIRGSFISFKNRKLPGYQFSFYQISMSACSVMAEGFVKVFVKTLLEASFVHVKIYQVTLPHV